MNVREMYSEHQKDEYCLIILRTRLMLFSDWLKACQPMTRHSLRELDNLRLVQPLPVLQLPGEEAGHGALQHSCQAVLSVFEVLTGQRDRQRGRALVSRDAF